MKDILQKGHFKGLDIAFTYAVTTATVNEAVVRHDCDPAAAHILGRAITASLLAAAILPEGRQLNGRWKYHGTLKTLVVDAGQNGTVRGFISPAQLGSFDNAHNALYGEIGELNLVVSQDGKIENSGTTPISLHDVVNDLAYHYCISDQIETGISVMIGFNADPENPVRLCQGLFLQALPNTDLERFDRIRRHLDNPDVRTALGTPADLKTLCQILLSEEPDFKGIQKETCPTPHFKCTCSLEKMATVVRSLPIPERMELVKKGEAVGIKCQFCNTHYELSINDCIKAWNTPSSVEN